MVDTTGFKNEETGLATFPSQAVAMEEDERFIMDLTAERKVQFCSMIPKNEDEEILLFNAMNNPKHRLTDFINKTITLRHVFCEIVNVYNENTGERDLCPRIVLIDTKGEGYQCVSLCVFSALKKIFSVKGSPDTWKKPVNLEVKQITKGVKNILTFNMLK